GPPPHGFGLREPLRIPAPALECADGVNFIHRLNLDLPARIAQRTRRVNVAVKMFCDLKPIYPRSETEAVFIRVTAAVEGSVAEHFGSWGWYSPPDSRPPLKKERNHGFIPLVDRAAQKHFPAVLLAIQAKWDDYQARWRVKL